jgi:hypothetical protein
VRAEINARGRLDVDEIMSHFSADAVWNNVAIRSFRGFDAIREGTTIDMSCTYENGRPAHSTSSPVSRVELRTAGSATMCQ